jgi:hypothetical protein
MEKTGKTSVTREMRRFLKEKNKDLHEINGLNQEKQMTILNDNTDSVILKQNGLLQLYYEKLAQRVSINNLLLEDSENIRKEQLIDHEYGSVHFFLIPKNSNVVSEIFTRTNEQVPSYYNDLRDFFEKINSTSLAQGLNIELIFFDEFDRIFDVRDKILELIEQKYEI